MTKQPTDNKSPTYTDISENTNTANASTLSPLAISTRQCASIVTALIISGIVTLIIVAQHNFDPALGQILAMIEFGSAAYVYRHVIIFDPKRTKYAQTHQHRARIPKTGDLLLFIVIICVMGTLSQVVMQVLTSVFGDEAAHNKIVNVYENSPGWAVFMLICIVAPVCEELIFRGVLHPVIRTRASRWIAIIATSLIFALFHGNITQGVTAFVIGCGLSALYERTGNAAVGVIAHASVNMLGITVSIMLSFTL